MTLIDVHHLCEIAKVEFDAVVLEAYVPDLNECRIIIQDGSFISERGAEWQGGQAVRPPIYKGEGERV
jgi:hypothetical protein